MYFIFKKRETNPKESKKILSELIFYFELLASRSLFTVFWIIVLVFQPNPLPFQLQQAAANLVTGWWQKGKEMNIEPRRINECSFNSNQLVKLSCGKFYFGVRRSGVSWPCSCTSRRVGLCHVGGQRWCWLLICKSVSVFYCNTSFCQTGRADDKVQQSPGSNARSLHRPESGYLWC